MPSTTSCTAKGDTLLLTAKIVDLLITIELVGDEHKVVPLQHNRRPRKVMGLSQSNQNRTTALSLSYREKHTLLIIQEIGSPKKD